MHHTVSRLSLLVLSLGISVGAAATSYAEYRVTVVGPPGSQATAINQAGAVVGSTWSGTTETYRSFVNFGRGAIELRLPGSVSNQVVAINDKGEVLGHWIARNGQRGGFVYARGSYRQLADVNGRATSYLDINNAGYILASSTPVGTPDYSYTPRSYLRAPDGKYRYLGAPRVEEPVVNLTALNNRNQAAGAAAPYTAPEIVFRTYTWSKGVLRQLDSFGHPPDRGLDINEHGQVAGYTSDLGFRESLATIWTHGKPTRIDTRRRVGSRESRAEGINNHGQVAGNSDHLNAFVYRGKKMESLNALIDRRSGWNITSAWAINDAGQIAANGERNGVQYAVRLDLIRPHALGTPYIAPDDEAETQAQVDADGKQD